MTQGQVPEVPAEGTISPEIEHSEATGQEPGQTDAGGVVERSEGAASKPEVFDREYVEQLRREAASYRVRAQEAQAALDALKKELEAKTRAIEEAERRMTEQAIEQAVLVEANRMGFYDPTDAVRLLDRDALKVEDGRVVGVEEALKALAQAKPHLVRRRAVADATEAAEQALAATMNERIRRAAAAKM